MKYEDGRVDFVWRRKGGDWCCVYPLDAMLPGGNRIVLESVAVDMSLLPWAARSVDVAQDPARVAVAFERDFTEKILEMADRLIRVEAKRMQEVVDFALCETDVIPYPCAYGLDMQGSWVNEEQPNIAQARTCLKIGSIGNALACMGKSQRQRWFIATKLEEIGVVHNYGFKIPKAR